MKILVINGPNLNRLGEREKSIYGRKTEADLIDCLQKKADSDTIIDYYQSNHEGEIIDHLYQAMDSEAPPKGLVLNLGAFSHYSIAILDALLSINIPFVEVHISNIFSRESFRRHSVIASHAVGQIAGLGFFGYEAAIDFLVEYLGEKDGN